LVLIIGQMMPMAPASSARMIWAGSFHGTRTRGVASLLLWIATISGTASLMLLPPCCMSRVTLSQPWAA
jgi:hypothetical protein